MGTLRCVKLMKLTIKLVNNMSLMSCRSFIEASDWSRAMNPGFSSVESNFYIANYNTLRGSHDLSAFRLLVFYILSHTIIMVLFYIISISYCKLYAVGQKFVTTLSHAFAGVFVSSWKKGFLGIGVASCLVPSAICRAIAAAASRRARIGRQQFSVFSTGSDLVRRRQCTAPD